MALRLLSTVAFLLGVVDGSKCADSDKVKGLSYHGGDLRWFNTTNPDECCGACAAELSCSGWTWNPVGGGGYAPNVCFLKKTLGVPVQWPKCVSSAPTPTPAPSPTPVGSKKGVGVGTPMCGDLDEGSLSSMDWWYDWGHTFAKYGSCLGNKTIPKNAEYVPQIWGHWTLKNATVVIQGLRDLQKNISAAGGKTMQHIFGFNEPDHSGSYLKPIDGAKAWPAMEQVASAMNLTLISPCVSNYASGEWWLNTFREAHVNYTGREPRFDHMCVHAYFQPDKISAMMDSLGRMYTDYKRPIWVNEFACPPYQNCTAVNQRKFMTAILPKLEASPYIHRYAWFVNRDERPSPKGDDSLQQRHSLALTDLGRYYNDNDFGSDVSSVVV